MRNRLQQVLALATANDTPVTPRALASSVTGQPLPTRGGIVLDLTGMAHQRAINTTNLTVEVSAGYNGGQLEDELQQMGWTLGHSPQSLYQSSVGGWLSTLATGQFSSYYGGIEDLITPIRLSSQRVKRYGSKPRRARRWGRIYATFYRRRRNAGRSNLGAAQDIPAAANASL
ncbi:glycolate oxidase, subunit GlcD [Raoultella terrigena]|uniref:Glycolate oxidase, subunit GlcD n=1 Tax=Raoultella terrigena TaxID=577 RepID=A0A4U9D8X7_RAOTE|nr:glycolate oxidase, subunit GlcD [Raoultella terrigena]